MEGRPQPGARDRRAGPRATRRRLGPDRRVTIVPGNHDAPLVRAWVRAQDRALGPSSRGSGRRVASASADRRVARAGARRRSATPACGCPSACGRRTATTWTATCCRCPRTESGAGRYDVARATAPCRPTTSSHGDRRSHGSRGRLPRPLAALLDDVAELVRAATMPRRAPAAAPRRLAPLTAARARARRCGARASRRSRGSSTGSGSTPTGSCSATSTGSVRSETMIRSRGADAGGRPRIAEHRLVGARAAARRTTRSPIAPVLARRRGAARGRRRPARDRAARRRSVSS